MRTKQDEEISEILDNIHDELENANYHNQIELPRDLYDAIKHLVLEEDRKTLAERIVMVFEENM